MPNWKGIFDGPSIASDGIHEMDVIDDSIRTAEFYGLSARVDRHSATAARSIVAMAMPMADALKQEEELWQRLHAVLLRLTPEMADRPGYFQEGWTAKDAVAHIGTWMAYGAAMLRRIAAGTYRESEIDVDAENARFLAAMRDIPLEMVHVQASAARSQLLPPGTS